MDNQTIKELTSFIKNSPTAFHAVKSIRDILTKEGFQELKESEKWKIEKGGKYYVTRPRRMPPQVRCGCFPPRSSGSGGCRKR